MCSSDLEDEEEDEEEEEEEIKSTTKYKSNPKPTSKSKSKPKPDKKQSENKVKPSWNSMLRSIQRLHHPLLRPGQVLTYPWSAITATATPIPMRG